MCTVPEGTTTSFWIKNEQNHEIQHLKKIKILNKIPQQMKNDILNDIFVVTLDIPNSSLTHCSMTNQHTYSLDIHTEKKSD